MSRARRIRKQQKLLKQQHWLAGRDYDQDPSIQNFVTWDRFMLVEMNTMSPIERIAQERHEMRVFGHNVGDEECTCTATDVDNLVLWNQPPRLWMGNGTRYHRRIKNRERA